MANYPYMPMGNFAQTPATPQHIQQYQTALPPWRSSHQHPPQQRRGRPGKVDSWRAYSNDSSSNLRIATNTGSTLNANATSFEPSPSQFRPYEQLRVSTGTTERRIVEAGSPLAMTGETANKNNNKKSINATASQQPPLVKPSVDLALRYPVRANRGHPADEPIPSIEGSEKITQSFGQALQELRRLRRNTPRASRTKSPEAPKTTVEYRAEAQRNPVRLSEPRKLLIILDLNGTLLYRTRRPKGNRVHMRPGVIPFLDYLLENHVVMVYTSAMPESAGDMLGQFLHPKQRNKLAAVWARDKLDLNKDQYGNKVQVYKKLDKVWNDNSIQQTAGPGNKWDQSNTVLIDDSHLKALAQPHNLLQVREYLPEHDPSKFTDKNEYQHAYEVQQDIMKQLQLKLEDLKYQENVSRLVRQWQDGDIDVPQVPGQEVVVEETVDQHEVQEQEKDEASQTKTHLPTPESLDDEDARGVSLQADITDEEVSVGARSVSPITESVFRELLEGTGKA